MLGDKQVSQLEDHIFLLNDKQIRNWQRGLNVIGSKLGNMMLWPENSQRTS